MTIGSNEGLAIEPLNYPPPPLVASHKLYTFDEIASAPVYFTSDGDPIQLYCTGLEEGKDGYNPSGIHHLKVHDSDSEPTAVTIIRTENSRGAYTAESRFCHYDQSGELTELDIPRRPWEDAAICVLPDGTIVTSGVRVQWNKDDPNRLDRFFTEYYYGASLEQQVYLGQSPDGHKDSRLAVINGQLILWTRPQQRKYEGKIYSTKLTIDELHAEPNDQGERIAQAVYDQAEPVGAGIFEDGTWGGPNGAVDIGDGWALVQCHAARRLWESTNPENTEVEPTALSELMEYVAFMLLHHVETGTAYVFGPHATEPQFPLGGSKWPKVRTVVFPGGLHDVRLHPETTIEGMATYGLRDKDMYARHWRSVFPLAQLLKTAVE